MNHRQRAALTIAELLARSVPPLPWKEGDNLPWDEPAFSRRMLREHLSQQNDAASRRTGRIDAHTTWIHAELGGQPARILDLGCGPGLYTQRLARLGHHCTGNHRMNTPIDTRGMLCPPMAFADPFLLKRPKRGPRSIAPTSAAVPPTACTTVDPAKS